MNKVVSIILAGGSGERLWPLSRKLSPKPFINVHGKTLIEHSILRANKVSDEILIITSEAYYFQIKKILNKISVKSKVSFLLESEAKNTALAIASGVKYLSSKFNGNQQCLVLCADHLIRDDLEFKKSIQEASLIAANNEIVVFGVNPTSVETGYGYIKVADDFEHNNKVDKFKEKPDFKTAQKYLLSGLYYWNSGIFLFSLDIIEKSFKTYALSIWNVAEEVFSSRNVSEDFCFINYSEFSDLENISFDCAIIEKSKNISMIKSRFDWSDIGSWVSLSETYGKDENGNSINSENLIINMKTQDTHVESVSHINKVIATIGLKNLIIADFPDALLIVDKKYNQEIKSLLNVIALQDKNDTLNYHVSVERPWGSFSVINKGTNFLIKKIIIDAHQSFSLQYHKHRDEHWFIVNGEGQVIINDEKFIAKQGDYFFVPKTKVHRFINDSSNELVFIEIQVGDTLLETDIVRIDDNYGRN